MRYLKGASVLLAAIGLSWLTIGIGLANMGGSAGARTALAVYPFDARARANLAEIGSALLLREPRLTDDVGQLARSALARDPTVADAWRLIGIVASVRGQAEQASRTLQFAQKVSRRDLLVQLWLIEDRVRQDDVAGALRHYDIALRTSPTSRQLLFPVLTSASAEPNVARPLAAILKANPAWRTEFSYFITHSRVTGDTLPLLVAQMATTANERAIMVPLVQRLVAAADYRNAWEVYRLLKQTPQAPRAELRDGGFGVDPTIAPFDWFMANEGAVRAERRIRANSAEDPALFLSAEAGSSGEGARQLMLLEPGNYQLSVAVGSIADTPAAGVQLQVACVRDATRALTEASTVASQPTGSLQKLRFMVPSGCPAQMLTVQVRSTTDVTASEAWIDNVAISRL